MIDERTGRQIGDRGTYSHALTFALDVYPDMADGAGDSTDFLRAWREGALDEYPEFYAWLAEQEAPPAEAPGIGRTELTGGDDQNG